MSRVMVQIERVAASESRACIYGETGTGKELVARTLRHTFPGRNRRHAHLHADLTALRAREG